MAQIKSYDTLSNVRDHIKKGKILSKGSNLTIASDAITVTDSYHLVAVESGSSDDLKTINGGKQAGQLLVLQAAADDKTVVVKNYASGTDNIRIGADVTLDDAKDSVTLMWNGSDWNMISSAATATVS